MALQFTHCSNSAPSPASFENRSDQPITYTIDTELRAAVRRHAAQGGGMAMVDWITDAVSYLTDADEVLAHNCDLRLRRKEFPSRADHLMIARSTVVDLTSLQDHLVAAGYSKRLLSLGALIATGMLIKAYKLSLIPRV